LQQNRPLLITPFFSSEPQGYDAANDLFLEKKLGSKQYHAIGLGG
jgi:hypothetical protein